MPAVIASRRNGTVARGRGQLAVDVRCISSQEQHSLQAHGVGGCKQDMQGWEKKRRTRNRRRAQRRMSVDRQWEA